MALRGIAGEAIDEMVLALPADPRRPRGPDQHQLAVQRAALQHRYGVRLLTIVNDFQAAALGAIAEPYDRLKVLNAATPDDGPVVVAGAGTGLGIRHGCPVRTLAACRAPPKAAIRLCAEQRTRTGIASLAQRTLWARLV